MGKGKKVKKKAKKRSCNLLIINLKEGRLQVRPATSRYAPAENKATGGSAAPGHQRPFSQLAFTFCRAPAEAGLSQLRSCCKSCALQSRHGPGLPPATSRHVSPPAPLVTGSGVGASPAASRRQLDGMLPGLLPTRRSQNGTSAEHPSKGLGQQKDAERSPRLPQGCRAAALEEG